MSKWLDTETKALLQGAPPEKDAPPTTDTFTLVLLRWGCDMAHAARSLARVPHISGEKAALLVAKACPLPIAGSLSMTDALLGQFELVCADAISVFLRDPVVSSSPGAYLARLYARFQSSPEFDDVFVNATSIPRTDQGQRFVDQFFGGLQHVGSDDPSGYAYAGIMMRKKARILAHWAKKIGAEATIENPPPLAL
jgi:hypothetical protein